MLKKLVCLLLIFVAVHNSAHAYVINVLSTGNAGGNVVAVWQDEMNTGSFKLIGSVLPLGGPWATNTNLSSSLTGSATSPKLVLNSSGNAIVIWSSFDSTLSYMLLYASTLTGLTTWSAPVQISEDTEYVYENYNVHLTDADDFVITYNSYIFDNVNNFAIRSVAGTFGTFPTPVTVSTGL